jgi:hypothetical protein
MISLNSVIRPFAATLLSFTCLVSCQKIKDLAKQVKEAAGDSSTPKEVVVTDPSAPGGEMDKALEALIDRTPEGVCFRKDLPFPRRLKVEEKIRVELQNVRVFSRNAFGAGSESISGVTERATSYEREGNRVAFRAESSSRMSSADKAAAPPADPKAPPGPPAKAPPAPVPAAAASTAKPADGAVPEPEPEKSVLSAVFQLKDGRWVAAREEDFILAAKIHDLQPGFGNQLVEGGLQPRTLWFGKTRWKEGAQLTLNDQQMAMIMAPGTTGKLELVYETAESVGGHPCGRFSVKGKCTGKVLSLPDGGQDDHQEVSITSGKIWLSLIQPIVIRTEYEMIATFSSKQGGQESRSQGQMLYRESLVWKPSN